MRLRAPKRLLCLAVVVAVLFTVILLVACGDSNKDSGGDHPDPAPTLYTLVDAINRGDTQSFYHGLSADGRTSTTAEDIQRAVHCVRDEVLFREWRHDRKRHADTVAIERS